MIALLLAHLRSRIAQARALRRSRPDMGAVIVEYVVVIAVVVTLAVAALAILGAKLLAKARSIDLGGGG